LIEEIVLDSHQPNLEEIFLASVEKDPADRQAFLEETCADSSVRTRVEALLKAHDSAGNFLEEPAVQAAPCVGTPDPISQGSDPHAARATLDFLDRCDTPGRLGLLANYEILEILGSGGMGVVLRGLDVKLNRVVAIKVLAPQLAANAVARRRFLREAQAAAAVSHEHVVAIYAVDEFKGLPYLVMECIGGSSLQQKIDGGPLELVPILRIGTQIASGLAAAHAQGLVHRDIKPANILLENGVERVKITDFGLARSIDDVRVTQAGVVYGTPLYMSPEQAHGERVDQRSDLFSLGSVLYTMSTGRPPFRGDTSLAVLRRVCDDAPRPIREINPDIPESLVDIVNKLLAKDPAARFQSAGEVAALLSRYLAHVQNDPVTPFPREEPPAEREETREISDELRRQPLERAAGSRPRWPLFAGAAVLILGIGVVAALEYARFTSWTGASQAPANSADKANPANKGADASGDTTPSKPSTLAMPAVPVKDRPIKVFILAGDSNMAGRAKVALLKYQANQAETKKRFRHLLHDGEWVVREDVWIKNLNQKGNLTVGFGQEPTMFGPELQFGNVVGDHFAEQVLLIKTCWGGSLFSHFRSPSSGLPPRETLEQELKELQKENAGATLSDVERRYGAAYRDMVTEVRDTLANLGEHFSGYHGQGYELAGFVWFQAWNDMIDSGKNSVYAENLTHFIRDVRRDFNAPNLPVIIGQLGVRGTDGLDANGLNLRTAQATVAQLPEFTGNVRLVATDPFWDHEAYAVYQKGWEQHKDEWNKVGSDRPFHYLGSAKTFCDIGKAFGEGMIELRRSGAKN
jgi:serine/threonine protein kinase